MTDSGFTPEDGLTSILAPKMGQPHLEINAAKQPIGPLSAALLASAARRREARDVAR